MRIQGQQIGGRVIRARVRYTFLPEAGKIQAKAQELVAKLPKSRPEQERTFGEELTAITAISDRYGGIHNLMLSDDGRDFLIHLAAMEMSLTDTLPLSRGRDEDMMQKGAIQVLRAILRECDNLQSGTTWLQKARQVWSDTKQRWQREKVSAMT